MFACAIRHSLLDAKINSVLSLCHDQAILNAVQSIIQNMIACEDASQQQLSYLQSKHHCLGVICVIFVYIGKLIADYFVVTGIGFGGLWRFAGPFTKVG